MLKKIQDEVININPIPLEVILAFESVILGLWLLLPVETFPTSVTFSTLADWPGEIATGLILLCVGLIRAYALYGHRLRLRRDIAIVGMIMWSYIDLSFWLSNPISTAPITYLVFVILSAWVLSSLTWKITRG